MVNRQKAEGILRNLRKYVGYLRDIAQTNLTAT